MTDGVAVPAPRRFQALIVGRDADAAVGQQPASLDRSAPMSLKPVGGALLVHAPHPLHKQLLQSKSGALERTLHNAAHILVILIVVLSRVEESAMRPVVLGNSRYMGLTDVGG